MIDVKVDETFYAIIDAMVDVMVGTMVDAIVAVMADAMVEKPPPPITKGLGSRRGQNPFYRCERFARTTLFRAVYE